MKKEINQAVILEPSKITFVDANSLNKPKIKKIIFGNPAVCVILENGKAYTSEADGEPYDAEKGLLMCLAKIHGYSYSDIKRMLPKGEINKTIEEEFKRMMMTIALDGIKNKFKHDLDKVLDGIKL